MPNPLPNIQDEEYYKLVADNINDLVAVYTPQGTIEYISPSLQRLTGHAQEEFTGIDPVPFIHPDDRALLKIDEACLGLNDKKVHQVEYRLLHKNGHWVYFDSYRQPIYDKDGKLVKVLAVCREVTQRKKHEQAIAESEELYRLLADNILDMVVIMNPDGTRRYVSPSSFSLLGYRPDELADSHYTDIVHPDDLEKVRYGILGKALSGQEKFLTELRLHHKNGHWLFCETTSKALRDADGNFTALVSTTRDITQWKLAQIALRESEERYRSLVESSDAMIGIVGLDGKFVFVNDKRADFFGEDKKNILGKTMYDFYGGAKADLFYERFNLVLQEKNKMVFESQATHKGRELWLRSTLLPVLDSAGNVSAVMVSTIDITGIRFSEDALRKQNDELKQIAFLQSHIVRSPLTNIQGILFLLNEDGMDAENRYYFQLLKQAAEKLDEIIKDIVDRAVVIRRHTMDGGL